MVSDVKRFKEAKLFHKNGEITKAIKIYLKLLKFEKENFEINLLLGTAYLQCEIYKKSIDFLTQAIKIKESPAAYNNIGLAFLKTKKYDEAIKNFKNSIELDSSFFQAYNNLGIVFRELKKFNDAIEHFKNANKINKYYYESFNNIGNTYKDLGNFKKSVENYKKAIFLNNNYADAYFNLGVIYQENNNYDEAKNCYLKVKKIDQNFNYIDGKILHNNMNLCSWDNFKKNLDQIDMLIENKKKIIEPFPYISVSNNLKKNKKVTEDFINSSFDFDKRYIKKKRNDKKIKIAYFSPDFSDHPVLRLMIDTFKNHNKSKFDFYAFSFGNKKKTKLHFEAKQYFKKFIYINNLSNKEVMKICDDLNIDIAIDLCGLTAENRIGLFANRIAPTQINYLGYPGTSGANFMDYIIADENIIPNNLFSGYSEKILYLPNCYQSNSEKEIIYNKEFLKSDFGLPDNQFIFCNFNNHNKITPHIFSAWMEILNHVEKSVIWLYVNNKTAQKNIILEAKKRGIKKNRIFFAEKLEHSKHLKRLSLADLFLDTFPYNAHTTGSDAFRMNLPILTIKGETFPSRVLASILQSNNLEELIKTNFKDYVLTAVKFATDKNEYKKIKSKVMEQKNKSLLFKNKKFTFELEKIYESLV